MGSIDNFKSMIHDLKTPLTSILGYVELIKESKNKKSINNFLDIIEFESQKLLNMINLLMDLSDIDFGAVGKVDCDKVISHVIREFDPVFKKKNIKVSYECDDKIEALFGEIDLWRVVSNIFSNSVKYGKEGGYLNVHVYEDSDFAVLEFVDNGIGIKNENLTNIFKKGFREEKNGDVVGHGYGLSNVREIVSKNGGIIYLESEPGKGSKFTIKLRLSD